MIQLLPEKLSEPSGSLTTLVHARRMIKLEIGRCDDRRGWWIESQLQSEIRLSSRSDSSRSAHSCSSGQPMPGDWFYLSFTPTSQSLSAGAMEHEGWPNKRKAR